MDNNIIDFGSPSPIITKADKQAWNELGEVTNNLPDEVLLEIFSHLGEPYTDYQFALPNLLKVNKQWARVATDERLLLLIAKHTTALNCSWLILQKNMPSFGVAQHCVAQMLLMMGHFAKNEWPKFRGGVVMAVTVSGQFVQEMYSSLADQIPNLDNQALVKTFRACKRLNTAVAHEPKGLVKGALAPNLFDSIRQDQLLVLYDAFSSNPNDQPALTPEEQQERQQCEEEVIALAGKLGSRK